MEVHHHSHSKRKKWIDHLWEFVMLFLAVFCGFLAENQREHYVEHQKEKQFIRSLIRDLKTDTANISNWVVWFTRIKKSCDTTLDNFTPFTKHYSRLFGRNFFSITGGFPDFIYTDRTMQQLKNSGGLRLIRNVAASDSIISYDAAVRDILIEETGVSLYFDQLNDLKNKMWSHQKFASEYKTKTFEEIEEQKINFWIKQDVEQFQLLYNLIYTYRRTIRFYIDGIDQLKAQATRLMVFLQREYRLK
jgi:hypothetical protein